MTPVLCSGFQYTKNKQNPQIQDKTVPFLCRAFAYEQRTGEKREFSLLSGRLPGGLSGPNMRPNICRTVLGAKFRAWSTNVVLYT